MQLQSARADRLVSAATFVAAGLLAAIIVLSQFRERYGPWGSALPAPTQMAMDGALIALWFAPAAVAYLHSVGLPPVLRIVAIWAVSTGAAFWFVGWVDSVWVAVVPAVLALVASLPRSVAMARVVRGVALVFAAANLLLFFRAAELPFEEPVRGWWVMP